MLRSNPTQAHTVTLRNTFLVTFESKYLILMGMFDELKRLLWVKKAVAKSAADKAGEKGKEIGEDLSTKASETWEKTKDVAEDIGEKIVEKAKEAKEAVVDLWDKKD